MFGWGIQLLPEITALSNCMTKQFAKFQSILMLLIVLPACYADSRTDRPLMLRENSALLRAAASGNVAAIHASLASGANPNAVSEIGDHAINLAADTGRPLACQALINAGADINAFGSRDRTALMAAAEAGNSPMVSLLLLHKASVFPKTDLGETALLLAARTGNPNCIISLINSGSEIGVSDKLGETPLLAVIRSAPRAGSLSGFWAIASRSNVNVADRQGRTPLMLAAQEEAPDEIKILLGRGANARAKDPAGLTALLYAAQSATAPGQGRSAQETAAMLLATSLKPADDGGRALLVAAAAGNDGAARGLLEEGAPVNAALPQEFIDQILAAKSGAARPAPLAFAPGMTPAMIAAAYGQSAAMKTLLAARANASARDSLGRTALMYAAGFSQASAVEILLEHGVDVDASDRDGNTALMHVAQITPASEEGLDGSLVASRIVRILVAAGANPNAKNIKGETALDIASRSGNLTVKTAISQYANAPASR